MSNEQTRLENNILIKKELINKIITKVNSTQGKFKKIFDKLDDNKSKEREKKDIIYDSIRTLEGLLLIFPDRSVIESRMTLVKKNEALDNMIKDFIYEFKHSGNVRRLLKLDQGQQFAKSILKDVNEAKSKRKLTGEERNQELISKLVVECENYHKQLVKAHPHTTESNPTIRLIEQMRSILNNENKPSMVLREFYQLCIEPTTAETFTSESASLPGLFGKNKDAGSKFLNSLMKEMTDVDSFEIPSAAAANFVLPPV